MSILKTLQGSPLIQDKSQSLQRVLKGIMWSATPHLPEISVFASAVMSPSPTPPLSPHLLYFSAETYINCRVFAIGPESTLLQTP